MLSIWFLYIAVALVRNIRKLRLESRNNYGNNYDIFGTLSILRDTSLIPYNKDSEILDLTWKAEMAECCRSKYRATGAAIERKGNR